jgi:FkbM family methyltransferase
MRLRELLYLLGWPRPASRSYGHEVVTFDLSGEGPVQFAHWLHPSVLAAPVRQEEVSALRTFLRPGDVVVDIGAHCGDTPVPFGLAVGPTGAVLAFEPNPYVFPVLAANATLNQDKLHILPHRYAIAPEDGPLTFEYGDPGYCNGGRHEGYSRWRHGSVFELRVEGVRLEPFLELNHPDLIDRIRFIKVDAEGFDRIILESIRGLIARTRPFLRTEMFKLATRKQRLELLHTVTSMGYRVVRMRSDTDYVGEPLAEADVMAWKTFDLFCFPD